MSKTGRKGTPARRPGRRERREAKRPLVLEGLPVGMRMKGGIRSNPIGDGYVAIVHIWDNIECRGEPQEWRSEEVFATEEEALQHYKTTIRPALDQVMAEMGNKRAGGKYIRRELD